MEGLRTQVLEGKWGLKGSELILSRKLLLSKEMKILYLRIRLLFDLFLNLVRRIFRDFLDGVALVG